MSEDVLFNCPHCDQELEVDASGAGTEIQCPACQEPIVIPSRTEAAEQGHPSSEETGGVGAKNPIETSAEKQVERHFQVPQHEDKEERLIEKPLKPLNKAAKEGISLCIKTFKRSDTAEVGKDNFDEVVNDFLIEVGEDNVVSVHPITYSHQDLASREWIADFGIVIVYRG